MLNGGLHAQQLADGMEVGQHLLEGGATKFGDWVAEMGEHAGEGIYPFALQIWEAIRAETRCLAEGAEVAQAGDPNAPKLQRSSPIECERRVDSPLATKETSLASYVYDLDAVKALANCPGAIDIECESPEFAWSIPSKRGQPNPDDVGMAVEQVEAWLRLNVFDSTHIEAALEYLLVTRREMLSWLENQRNLFPESLDFEDRCLRLSWYTEEIEPQVEAIQRLLEARQQESRRRTAGSKHKRLPEPAPERSTEERELGAREEWE